MSKLANKQLFKVGIATLIVLAIVLSFFVASPANALTITFPSVPASGELGSTYTFTMQVSIENTDKLPVTRVNMQIFNVLAPDDYKIDLHDFPIPTTPDVYSYDGYNIDGSTITVSGLAANDWGYAYADERYAEYGTTTSTYPAGYGFGYSGYGNVGITSVTYTIGWTSPPNWPEGEYQATAFVYGDDTTNAITVDTETFDLEYGTDRWALQTVDDTVSAGWWNSLVIDSSDHPHDSYYDFSNHDLKYTWWNGTIWQFETVDGNLTDDIGRWTSLALDSGGNPHISYYDRTHQTLKYASRSGSEWESETIDTIGLDNEDNWLTGARTALALDSDGNPHISYYDITNGDLKYASWNGSTWDIQSVDTGGNVGSWSSMKLDSTDLPHISYYDTTNDVLKYAHWDGSTWSLTTVDNGSGGRWTSLALDSTDYPHISYYTLRLKYAVWNGSTWSSEIVDSGPDNGYWSSLKLDSQGNPHITTFAFSTRTLKYSQLVGSNWEIETVDAAGDVGAQSSFALDSNDYPHVAYLDNTNLSLKYATLMPSVSTGSVTSIGTTSAQLNGTLISSAVSATSVSFEYGTTISYGQTTAAQPMTANGVFSASINSLNSSTTYHVRAVAETTLFGTVYGSDMEFKTKTSSGGGGGGGAVYTTVAYSGLTGGKLQLNGLGISQGAVILKTTDGLASLTIPAGTELLTSAGKVLTQITASPVTAPQEPPPDDVVVVAYDFGPNGAEFSPPITLTITFEPNSLPSGTTLENPRMAYWDGTKWVVLTATLDAANNSLSAKVSHFTVFGVLAKAVAPPVTTTTQTTSATLTTTTTTVPVSTTTKPVSTTTKPTTTTTTTAPKPASFKLSDLTVTPTAIKKGETVTISAIVTNIGETAGSYTVDLKIDQTVVDSKDISLAAGDSTQVTFTTKGDKEGSFQLWVNDLSGNFTVGKSQLSMPWWSWLIIILVVLVIMVGIWFNNRRSANKTN